MMVVNYLAGRLKCLGSLAVGLGEERHSLPRSHAGAAERGEQPRLPPCPPLGLYQIHHFVLVVFQTIK